MDSEEDLLIQVSILEACVLSVVIYVDDIIIIGSEAGALQKVKSDLYFALA